MNQQQLKNAIEAVLMTAGKPVTIATLLKLFAQQQPPPGKTDITDAIDKIEEDYQDRGIEIKEVASGFRVQVSTEYAHYVNQLFYDKPPKYSRALLETLAIIVYRQPLTRAEIEDIRGVGVSANIIRTLQERNWIRIVGHKDVPGKPELLATSKEFLDYFNLKELSELPELSEIKDLNTMSSGMLSQLAHELPLATKDESSSSDQVVVGEQLATVDDAKKGNGDTTNKISSVVES